MKKVLLISMIVVMGLTTTAQAAHGSVGLGVQLGVPTGLTGKFWIDRTSAIDVTMGWNVYSDWVVIQAGYLYHFPLQMRQRGSLFAYIGAGGKMDVWDSGPNSDGGFRLAGRIPLGMEFIFDPISFYAELDPLIYLLPGTDLEIGGGLGFRFYF